MRYLFFLLLLFSFEYETATAQETPAQRSDRKVFMKEQIKLLKNGVLLVRLETKEYAIAKLIEGGQVQLAGEIESRQYDYNLKILKAFKENFTFCPVYFFYSKYSEDILSGNINNIIFLNDSLQPDTVLKPVKSFFLTAEFGLISQDTARYFTQNYKYRSYAGLESRRVVYGEPDMRFGAFKIMSDKLVQLKRPFPYYVRTFESLPIRRRLSKAVKRMDELLTRFLNKNE